MKACPVHLEIARTWEGKPIEAGGEIHIRLEVAGDDLVVVIDAPFHNDPPPIGPAGPTDGLWEYEVVEVFIAGPAERYLEIELGPHGHHLVLQLAEVRVPSATRLPIEYQAQIEKKRWQGTARIPLTLLPAGPHRINATAISGIGEARRYLSIDALPGPAPDFHQPEHFPVRVKLT